MPLTAKHRKHDPKVFLVDGIRIDIYGIRAPGGSFLLVDIDYSVFLSKLETCTFSDGDPVPPPGPGSVSPLRHLDHAIRLLEREDMSRQTPFQRCRTLTKYNQ